MADRHLDISFGLQVAESSSLVSVHFRDCICVVAIVSVHSEKTRLKKMILIIIR